jgi:hypothetical protein
VRFKIKLYFWLILIANTLSTKDLQSLFSASVFLLQCYFVLCRLQIIIKISDKTDIRILILIQFYLNTLLQNTEVYLVLQVICNLQVHSVNTANIHSL